MKLVNVTIVAAPDKKASKKLTLLPLITVAQYLKEADLLLTVVQANTLSRINKNTTYTIDYEGGEYYAPVDKVVDKGKMKIVQFDPNGKITFHNLQVYSYEGNMYVLEGDVD